MLLYSEKVIQNEFFTACILSYKEMYIAFPLLLVFLILNSYVIRLNTACT